MKLKIAVEGKTYEVEVEVLEGGENFLLPSGTVSRTPSAPGVKRAPTMAPKKPSPVLTKNACTSPLAGNVWKVLVEPGQTVEIDQPVVIIEAMKMETVIAAPMAGAVKAVHVSPGDAVKVNQVLVELE